MVAPKFFNVEVYRRIGGLEEHRFLMPFIFHGHYCVGGLGVKDNGASARNGVHRRTGGLER